jgi:hypothetical protein
METLVPAYGRDYKSQAAVKADWEGKKDFILNNVMSRWDGKPANRDSFQPGTRVQIRYAELRKVMVVTA